MKPSYIFALIILAAVPIRAQRILVDHNSVAQFEHIPAQYIEAAMNLRLLFMDRSVGGNISDALTCLSYPHAAAPSSCKRFTHRDSSYAVDPSEVFWEGSWDRSRWRYEYWPNGCSEDADCFVGFIEPRIDSFDVVGFQFSYLAVMPGSNLIHPVDGFFGSRTDRGTATSYTAFAARHPEKTVIWWTTSLARGIGTPESQTFNDAMRNYARVHDLVLFDVADILSHTPAGDPCYDNRDGVAYLDENHPDDGIDIPAICPQYTTETEGGHLGSISAGGIRVAKAFWVLMARIAGWDGVTSAGDRFSPRSLPARPLLSVAPNPSSDNFHVSFTLPDRGSMRLEIMDVLGRRVMVLLDGQGEAGAHTMNYTVRAPLVKGGIYFLRLVTEHGAATDPLVIK
ncbi:MAG: T9SS type A sorting domain-containing protein [Bacteroidota bacterium]